jgi:CRP/FNR family transcriptional regulator, cyclic AMP receptor protein
MMRVPDVPAHIFQEDLFSGLPGSAAEHFRAIESRVFYEGGTTLFRRDQNASTLFVIHRGSVAVSISGWEDGLAGSPTYTAGEILGLSAVVAGEPYQASARTLELAEIGLVSRGDFLEFLSTHSDFAFRLVGFLSEDLSDALDHLRALPPVIHA